MIAFELAEDDLWGLLISPIYELHSTVTLLLDLTEPVYQMKSLNRTLSVKMQN